MKVWENAPLSKFTYYKIGGPAKLIIEIRTKEDLAQALEYLYKKKITRIHPMGLGSNTIFPDSGFDGAILWFTKPKEPIIQKDHHTLTVFSSLLLDDVIQYSFLHNLGGLAWAGGLPSTVGGAVRGNVGAFGHEVKDVIKSVTVYELHPLKFIEKSFTNEQLKFSYRDSVIKQSKNMIVIDTTFSLKLMDYPDIKEQLAEYKDHIAYRQKNHPMEYPSCGSIFKNISNKSDVEKILKVWPDIKDIVKEKWHGKVSMGYINERLGLAGYEVGGAQLSLKHKNYIVNKKRATATDVLSIILTIEQRFSDTFGFLPEREVEVIQ